MRYVSAVLIAASLVMLAAIPAAARPRQDEPAAVARYTITDLGTLGGSSTRALDINNLGQVVGTSFVAPFESHAFIWEAGQMIDLTPLLTEALRQYDPSFETGVLNQVTGINDHGQIVGEFSASSPEGIFSFLYEYGSGAFRLINMDAYPFSLGDSLTSVSDISNSGYVAGTFYPEETPEIPFRWVDGAAEFLYVGQDIYGYGNGINDSGELVGSVRLCGSRDEAFVWTADGARILDSLTRAANDDCSVTGVSSASAINNNGQIAGSSLSQDGSIHAVLWDDAGIIDLGTLGGSDAGAVDINSLGQVVGSSRTADGGTYHAFLAEQGAMMDLNALIPADSGWELTGATAINDRGQIVGVGTVNGQSRSFLLTPADPAALIDALRGTVESLPVAADVKEGLIDKLDAAEASVARGKLTPACHQLDAFVRQVNAQAGKALNSDQADQLRSAATDVLVLLGC